MTIEGKPRKRDFADMREFLHAAAAWAEANMSEWPWGGSKDEDDDYYFIVSEIQKSAPALLGSLPSGESDPSVTLDCVGADTQQTRGA